jgi:hypothetical protein
VGSTCCTFFLNGEHLIEGGMFRSYEDCMEKVSEIPAMIASFNESAENPVKVVSYNAGCVPMKKAPQGKAV